MYSYLFLVMRDCAQFPFEVEFEIEPSIEVRIAKARELLDECKKGKRKLSHWSVLCSPILERPHTYGKAEYLIIE